MVCYSRLFLFIATEQQLPISMMANLLMWHYRNLFKSSSKWVLSLTRSTVKSISNISVLMILDAFITRESMTGSRAKVKARSRRNCVCVCLQIYRSAVPDYLTSTHLETQPLKNSLSMHYYFSESRMFLEVTIDSLTIHSICLPQATPSESPKIPHNRSGKFGSVAYFTCLSEFVQLLTPCRNGAHCYYHFYVVNWVFIELRTQRG